MTIMQAIREQLEFRRVRAELRHFKAMYAFPVEDTALNMLARSICAHKIEPVKAIVDLTTGTDHGYEASGNSCFTGTMDACPSRRSFSSVTISGHRQPSHWVRGKVLYESGLERQFVARCYIGAHELEGALA